MGLSWASGIGIFPEKSPMPKPRFEIHSEAFHALYALDAAALALLPRHRVKQQVPQAAWNAWSDAHMVRRRGKILPGKLADKSAT